MFVHIIVINELSFPSERKDFSKEEVHGESTDEQSQRTNKQM